MKSITMLKSSMLIYSLAIFLAPHVISHKELNPDSLELFQPPIDDTPYSSGDEALRSVERENVNPSRESIHGASKEIFPQQIVLEHTGDSLPSIVFLPGFKFRRIPPNYRIKPFYSPTQQSVVTNTEQDRERRNFPEIDSRGFDEDIFDEGFGEWYPMKRF